MTCMNQKINADLKFLELPNNEDILAVIGSDGIREYGAFKNDKKSDKAHFHNLMEIGICRWGKGEVYLEHKWYPYKSGDIIVIPKNYPHAINSYGEKSFWEYIYIKPSAFLEAICKENSRKRSRYIDAIECRSFIKSREKIQDLEGMINLIMNQTRVQAYGYRECIRGLIYALLMEIVKINHIDQNKPEFKNNPGPQKLTTLSLAMEYIEENYNRELRISDVANAAHVSETALRRLFVECCEISPMQYLKRIRIDAACKIMKNSDVNINEIAYSVGFENTATFISNFKKIQGCTPKQWEHKNLRKTDKTGEMRNE